MRGGKTRGPARGSGAGRALGGAAKKGPREGRLGEGLGEDLRELYRFYLPEELRERLARMGRLRRWAVAGWHLMRSLLQRLSPGRRLALVLALAATLLGAVQFRYAGDFGFSVDFGFWGFLIVLVVLMLELKDKLLARDEIAVARQVQLALLPHEHPWVAGWSVWSVTRPANDVGGDLVDYVEVPGGMALVLGDVAGKGLGAALLAAKLQATVRAIAAENPSLAELGRRLNAVLHRDGIENRYATLFLAEISAGSGGVRFLNAGHNPAIVVRGAAQEALGASAPPLGMFGEASYGEGAVDLGPGDLLVAYSDGLTEATDAEGVEFGEARLAGAAASLHGLAACEAGPRLLREVEAHVGAGRLRDDLSIVVASRRPDR